MLRKLALAFVVFSFALAFPLTVEAKHKKAAPAKVEKSKGDRPVNKITTLRKVMKKRPAKPAPGKAPSPAPRMRQVTAVAKAGNCVHDPSVSAGKIDILQKICEGKKLLSGLQAKMKVCDVYGNVCKGKGKKKVCHKVVVSRPICDRSIILAAMDTETGKIRSVEVDNGRSSVSGFSVRQMTRDGVDSEYLVQSPPGWVVVALQYPLTLRTADGVVRERAIYTPYSRELREKYPELVDAGIKRLAKLIKEAREKIAAAGVDVSMIPDKVIMSLIFIEHFASEEVNDNGAKEEVWAILMTLGTNGDEAFKYAVSTARARGLAQIIPVTWASLHRRYPKLVPADFFRGTADHLTAVVAQFLLEKEDLSFLFSQLGWRNDADRQKRFAAEGGGKRLGEYLAVAYNGGAPHSYCWENGGRKVALRRESRLYLVKFDQVWRLAFTS